MSNISIAQAMKMMQDPERVESLATIVAMLSAADQATVMEGMDPETVLYDWNFWARPSQIIPREPYFNMHLLLTGRGWGKGYQLDTMMLTPFGWTTIGELNTGDKIFDERGNVCTITQAHEPYYASEVYEFKFSDGTTTITDTPHQWVTWTHADRKAYLRSKTREAYGGFPDDWVNWRAHTRWGAVMPNHPKIRTTQEIVDTFTYGKRGDLNHSIPLTRPLNLPDADVPIDPYFLGLWLGDGSSYGSEICGHSDDLVFIRNEILARGYQSAEMRLIRDNTWTFSTPTIRRILRETDLHKNKHVPAEYLLGSEKQRVDLLAGLLDSDGYISKENGQIEFCNTNKDIADAVVQLARSLGQKPVMGVGVSRLYGKDCGPKYRVKWRPTRADLFKLPRKAEGYRALGAQSLRNFHRMIEGAEKLTGRMVRCLTVDSPNSMYLVGEGLIPTHNTRTMSEWVRQKAMSKPKTRIGLMGRTAADTRDVFVMGESGILSIPQPEDELPIYKPSEAKVVWPNGSEAKLMSAESPDAVRGAQYEYSAVDELAAHTPYIGVDGLTAFENVRLATRLGDKPQLIVATTPKRVKVLRDLIEDAKEPYSSIRIVRGKTSENKGNLSKVYLDVIHGQFAGTSQARQELDGEMLDEEPEGALWKEEDIKHAFEVGVEDAMKLPLRIVAVDPSVAEEPNDECGIVVMGSTNHKLLHKRQGYVLEDASLKASPEVWAQKVVDTARKWKAQGVVVEKNQGHHLLTMAIHSIDPTIKVWGVNAKQGKALRADPVSMIYQQGRIRHLMEFPLLEDQMTSWEPGVTKKSPDRADAMVHGATALFLSPPTDLQTRKITARATRGTLPTGIGTGRSRDARRVSGV